MRRLEQLAGRGSDPVRVDPLALDQILSTPDETLSCMTL